MDNLKKYFLQQGMGKELQVDEVVTRIKYASFVGEQYPFLFIETPKCACSTMKKVMAHIEGKEIARKHVFKETTLDMSLHSRNVHPVKSLDQYPTLKINELLNSSSVTRFCVVRNPYARLVSAWADKIRQKEPAYQKYWAIIANFNNKSQEECPSFDDFIQWVTSYGHDGIDPHWKAMKELLLPELINYSFVIKTESLTEDFQCVLDSIGYNSSAKELLQRFRMNESLPINWKSMYREELAEKVFNYFEEDFLFFEYGKDSWKIENNKPTNQHSNSEVINAALGAIRARNELIDYLIIENRNLKLLTIRQRLKNRLSKLFRSIQLIKQR